jgi:hypothetical protein
MIGSLLFNCQCPPVLKKFFPLAALSKFPGFWPFFYLCFPVKIRSVLKNKQSPSTPLLVRRPRENRGKRRLLEARETSTSSHRPVYLRAIRVPSPPRKFVSSSDYLTSSRLWASSLLYISYLCFQLSTIYPVTFLLSDQLDAGLFLLSLVVYLVLLSALMPGTLH